MKYSAENLDHASVRQYCKAVRVPVIGANFLTLAEQAVKERTTAMSAIWKRCWPWKAKNGIDMRFRIGYAMRSCRASKRWKSSTLDRHREFQRRGCASWARADTSTAVNR